MYFQLNCQIFATGQILLALFLDWFLVEQPNTITNLQTFDMSNINNIHPNIIQ